MEDDVIISKVITTEYQIKNMKIEEPVTPTFLTKVCVLCQNQYWGHGHNAEPLAIGRCCSLCNDNVILARFKLFNDDSK